MSWQQNKRSALGVVASLVILLTGLTSWRLSLSQSDVGAVDRQLSAPVGVELGQGGRTRVMHARLQAMANGESRYQVDLKTEAK